MKAKRQKQFRRIMRFYRVACGIDEPYRVLIDGPFIQASLKQKVHIKEQLPKMLGGRCTPVVTTCTMAELRKLGPDLLGAVLVAKNFYRHKCHHTKAIQEAPKPPDGKDAPPEAADDANDLEAEGLELADHDASTPPPGAKKRPREVDCPQDDDDVVHRVVPTSAVQSRESLEGGGWRAWKRRKMDEGEEGTIDAAECIKQLLGSSNPHRFCVATQDRTLQAFVRRIPRVPLLYLHGSVPLIEEPSDAAKASLSKREEQQAGPREWERPFLKDATAKAQQDQDAAQKKKKKKKGKNPLSCLPKKPKRPKLSPAAADGAKKPRVRSRSRHRTTEGDDAGHEG
ncbi:unnamed protein product [Vitrella brassicaformis CCMP3155]|uniref:PIN domain-containing protein n=2 Tax=Vitrella brassicaformis TaxID=1169539 RepID=A0A0G4EHD7_VITBC|nr:unnamed protein product [Vitrella brassicaformis CCMP3155]|mmetsp:Transcript_1965/g.4307  ORF Transcript_1965/g.4307 Transcript_1965/m.4307 type:complete len:341 (+) Transcript_1965:1-1023(+)|eukprot:CEL95589.1 unnamed protein product [Vitrella brassicaformis CCMP3155]